MAKPRFSRPDGWRNLDGSPTQPAPTPPRPAPAPPPPPGRAPQPLPPHPPGQPGQQSPRSLKPATIIITVSLGMVFLLMLAASFLLDRTPRDVSPPPVPTSAPPPAPARDQPTEVWAQQATSLRPELGLAEFEGSVDGFFEYIRVIDADGVWAAITQREGGGDAKVHGFDAATGEELWSVPMEGAYCAHDLLDGQIACAGATTLEENNLGTQWGIHLLNPITGASNVTAEFDGWVTGILVEHGHVVLLEQRLPAPHAVVTGLDAGLTQVWQFDLAEQANHDGMFSDNRIWMRAERYPEGPALDRPRFRRVGDGLTALWSGQSTAFLDVRAGELKAMAFCSRLVDDGELIWCNAGDTAVAHNYEFEVQFQTEHRIRLAFPHRDPAQGDVTVPLFLNDGGQLMEVDRGTGQTMGRMARTRTGSAFGMTTFPSTASVHGVALVSDRNMTVSLDGETGQILWELDDGLDLSDPVEYRGNVLMGSSTVREVSPTTGEVLSSWSVGVGRIFTEGEQLSLSSSEHIARIELR